MDLDGLASVAKRTETANRTRCHPPISAHTGGSKGRIRSPILPVAGGMRLGRRAGSRGCGNRATGKEAAGVGYPRGGVLHAFLNAHPATTIVGTAIIPMTTNIPESSAVLAACAIPVASCGTPCTPLDTPEDATPSPARPPRTKQGQDRHTPSHPAKTRYSAKQPPTTQALLQGS